MFLVTADETVGFACKRRIQDFLIVGIVCGPGRPVRGEDELGGVAQCGDPFHGSDAGIDTPQLLHGLVVFG